MSISKEQEILKKRLEELEKKYRESPFSNNFKKQAEQSRQKNEQELDNRKRVEEELKLKRKVEIQEAEKASEKRVVKKIAPKIIKRRAFKEEELFESQQLQTAQIVKPSDEEIRVCAENIKKIKKEIAKVIVGQEDVVNGLVMGLLCDAHVLVEGVPGIAKTLAIRALASVSGCSVKRIQFTVDMLPADIIGITSYTPEKGFEVIKGPIFANFLIADEINRATPKCVLGDTPIIMGNGEISDIKEIIKKYNGKKTYKKDNEYWIVPKKKLKLLAFDISNCKIRPEEVKYLYKQKTSEPYYEVELKSGRKIKTSKIHPFFTLENGKVKTIQVNELKKGKCVLIPRKLSIHGNNKLYYDRKFLEKSKEIYKEIEKRKTLYAKVQNFKKQGFGFLKSKKKLSIHNKKDKNLIETFLILKPRYLNYDSEYFFSGARQFGQVRGIKKPKFITEEFAKFIAILISEGSVNKSSFYLTMKEKEIPELFIELIKKLFGLNANLLYDRRRKQYRVAFRSDALIGLLNALGYEPRLNADKKYIPQFILKAKEDIVKEFLKVYYECDGCVSRGCVKITTKSKNIANSLSYLLLRMGFVARISRELAKTNINEYSYKRKFYNLRLYGGELNEFYKKINFFTEKNKKKLMSLIKTFDRKQIDLVPGMHQLIRDSRKERNLSHEQFYNLTGMHAHNLENPKNSLMHSRHILHKISKIFLNSSISKIVNGDFYCDFVKNNKIIKPKKDYWLYDFSMKNKPSFVAGFGGIISHNTQSALMEAMQEKQVTIGRKSFQLPLPFFVMATENPIENAGVYPLPEAQIDRFLFKLIMGYPEEDEEKEVMETNITLRKFEEFDLKPVTSPEEIIKMQEIVKKIYLDDNIKSYIASIVRKTREKDFPNAEYISYGSSPRASIGLFIASKARALMQGRNYVLPEDVKKVAFDVLRHRLILSYKANIQKISPDDLVKDILNLVKVE